MVSSSNSKQNGICHRNGSMMATPIDTISKQACGDAFPIEGVLVATYLLSVEALPHCRCGVANKNRIV